MERGGVTMATGRPYSTTHTHKGRSGVREMTEKLAERCVRSWSCQEQGVTMATDQTARRPEDRIMLVAVRGTCQVHSDTVVVGVLHQDH